MVWFMDVSKLADIGWTFRVEDHQSSGRLPQKRGVGFSSSQIILLNCFTETPTNGLSYTVCSMVWYHLEHTVHLLDKHAAATVETVFKTLNCCYSSDV